MIDSPVTSLLRNVWQNAHRRSWLTLNQCLAEAVAIAIRGGYKFTPLDFKVIAAPPYLDGFDGFRWLGEHERFYSLACGVERGTYNLSAAISYELWRERTPFLLSQPDMKSKVRLARNSEFVWGEQRWTVNSIGEANGSERINARWCKPDGSVERRIQITHADIKAYHDSLKQLKAAAEVTG